MNKKSKDSVVQNHTIKKQQLCIMETVLINKPRKSEDVLCNKRQR
jgi:hypothetical protein